MNLADNPTSHSPLRKGRALLHLAVLAPFVLGAALHLSAVFKMFAGLPLVYAYLRFGRAGGILCSITNMALVWAIAGRTDAAWFFVLSVVLGTTLVECIKLKLRLEWTAIASVAMMIVASFVLLFSYSHKVNKNPLQLVKGFVGGQVDIFTKNAEKYKASSTVPSQDLDKVLIDPELTKTNILQSAPSIVLISFLALVVVNILMLFRLNIMGARDQLGLAPGFFKAWKAPEHMVWPALVAAFCVVIEIPKVSEVALNVFRILMAIYALQGLAILNYLFDVWGVRTVFRPLGYLLAMTFLLPFILSLGFFDLWANFREKIQTK